MAEVRMDIHDLSAALADPLSSEGKGFFMNLRELLRAGDAVVFEERPGGGSGETVRTISTEEELDQLLNEDQT